MENLRNIVILKDLPSNVIEEAFVVLKKNQKVRKLEHIDNKNNNFVCEKNGEDDNEFIIREAELLLADYIDDCDYEENSIYKINNNFEKKYKRMKRITALLAGSLFFAVIYILL